ncbi:hypothetical protein N7E81_13590 [Reichenbachiella carrageenanivorans]|uniref:Uncharacterized protein n=1 Tax=Reichenbachiella carrageenanivorans TaxID=2979869 RepID=A0ABY6CWT9_9BACT|nr:hypothetical protein [Reichenbachiella carrageenanivorans]UXX78389.1 hypothetical protein N7E81_13590 [Reichenbachiella carrageenanivorans]
MEARQTDKLFRDKLKSATTTPQAASWDRLEAMLEEKEKTGFYLWRVVVMLVLLIVSVGVVIFWSRESEIPVEVIAVEQPSETIKDSRRVIPLAIDTSKVAIKEVISPSVDGVKTSDHPRKKTTERVTQEHREVTPIRIEKEELPLAQVEVPQDTIVEPVKKKYKSIRITYKRGGQKEMLAKVDTVAGSKVKDFWAQTREINPADMWADIREAKDNLFQRNSRKNNVKNLNK